MSMCVRTMSLTHTERSFGLILDWLLATPPPLKKINVILLAMGGASTYIKYKNFLENDLSMAWFNK